MGFIHNIIFSMLASICIFIFVDEDSFRLNKRTPILSTEYEIRLWDRIPLVNNSKSVTTGPTVVVSVMNCRCAL